MSQATIEKPQGSVEDTNMHYLSFASIANDTIKLSGLTVGSRRAARRYHLLVSWTAEDTGATHQEHLAGSDDLALATALARGNAATKVKRGARYADCRVIDTLRSNAVVCVQRAWG